MTSCSTQGFVSSVTRADIRQMTMFETLANVGVIEKGNKIVYNDSLTKIAKALFETELNNDKTLPVSETFLIEDSVINNKIQYEIYFIMTCLERNIRPKDIPVPPTVDSILCSRNERFGVLAYNWGFTAPPATMPDRSPKASPSASSPWDPITLCLTRT